MKPYMKCNSRAFSCKCYCKQFCTNPYCDVLEEYPFLSFWNTMKKGEGIKGVNDENVFQ